jgi:DNA gyrase/topoisomerase IV subunit B
MAGDYSASSIEVLEGLEPVRKRPGMYIGGTDERALHHLFAEVLDNAMDEAVARHAKLITVDLDAEGWLSVKDDGPGVGAALLARLGRHTVELFHITQHGDKVELREGRAAGAGQVRALRFV